MTRYILSLEFDQDWVLERNKMAGLPVEQFISSFADNLDSSVKIKQIDKTFTTCKLLVTAYDCSADAVEFLAKQILTDVLDIKLCNKNYLLAVSAPSDEKETSKDTKIQKKSAKPTKVQRQDSRTNQENKTKERNAQVKAIMKSVGTSLGGEEFKSLAAELVKIAPEIKKYSADRAFISQSYLFAINEGCGLSSYLSLLRDLFFSLELTNEKYSVSEIKLDFADATDANRHPAVASFNNLFSRGSKNVICIDISAWLSHLNSEHFRELLDYLHGLRESHIFVFRVPFIESLSLTKIHETLNDVLFTRQVVFNPISDKDYLKYAISAISKCNLSLDASAKEVFYKKLNIEKGNGRFYGLHTINKIVDEIIYTKLKSNTNDKPGSSKILKNDISGIVSGYSLANGISGMEMLNSLVGIEKIKDSILEIIASIEEQKALEKKNIVINKPCIHMRFMGSPGTGKTTVGRIIGKILREKGLLRVGDFIEVSKKDLCGKYVGETSPKTSQVCRNAYGSVLFIDEAYSLAESRNLDLTSSYSREALDTLISEMENHRDDMVVIMAGYPDEMEQLMQTNVGLQDRLTYELYFPNYTRDELCDIFFSMVDAAFAYDDLFVKAVTEFFNSIPEETYNERTFSNARFVRNFYERVWSKATMRRRLNNEENIRLMAEDVSKAVSDKEFGDLVKRVSTRCPVGFLN